MNALDFYEFKENDLVINDNAPFKDQLNNLLKRKDNLPLHIKKTIEFAEKVLINIEFPGKVPDFYYNDILKDVNKANIDNFEKLLNKIMNIIKRYDNEEDKVNKHEDMDNNQNIVFKNYREFIKIAALYHDIGKTIENENHPQIGLYILNDFYNEQKQNLINKISSNAFTLLCSVIQHHDKFGVVQTGEASLSIFADIPYYKSNLSTIKEVKENFAFVCLCNIIDIASTISNDGKPKGISSEQINLIYSDWNDLMDAIDKSDGEREKLRTRLMTIDREPHKAIDRITRLIKSSTRDFDKINVLIDSTLIEKNITRVLQCRMNDFADGLSHITKLDYGLKFLRDIVLKYCWKHYKDVLKLKSPSFDSLSTNINKYDIDMFPSDTDKTREEKEKAKKVAREEAHKLINQFLNSKEHADKSETYCNYIIYIIVKMLERFVLRYQWILKSKVNDPGRRIGFEMSKVSVNDELTGNIINFLIENVSEAAALNWIIDKTPIWSID